MAQYSKRGRNSNRRRQGGNNNPNRSMDSQGPEVKIRGTATQIYDKYQALARDAASSGDRIRAESLMQHAEHYYRLMKSMQPAEKPSDKKPDDNTTGGGDTPQAKATDGQKPDSPKDEGASETIAEPSPEEAKGKAADDKADGDTDRSGDAEAEAPPRRRRRRRRNSDEDGTAGESTAKAAPALEDAPAE